MMKENETMASVPFQHYVRTMLAIAKEGIPADGEEPVFPPQPNMMGTGDLAYQQKVAGDIGGGCKTKNHLVHTVPVQVHNMTSYHMSLAS